MKSPPTAIPAPLGGLAVNRRMTRAWRESTGDASLTKPLRCRKDQWYLAQALPNNADVQRADLRVRFLIDDELLSEQSVRLDAGPSRNGHAPLLGWVQSPPTATHVQIELARDSIIAVGQLFLRPVAERDPKCHPGANVPRWNTYEPPFPLTRLVLPASLRALADTVPQHDVLILDQPKSMRQLAARSMGAAVILDAQWIRSLRLKLRDIEQLASIAYVLVDLESFARLLAAAGHPDVQCRSCAAAHEIMSARVIYADLATRGFAMQDVFPYAALDDRGRFVTRALTMGRAWKRYADEHDFAPLLASETPSAARSGDILAAVRAIGRGELLVTDLPWLATGAFGPPLAPRLAAQLLRMHLGSPIADHVQYWNRWDETHIVVRDLLDLSRRYAPLRAYRWARPDDATAALGLTLPAWELPAQRHVIIQTGRIDNLASHDGLAPESLAIFMKWLARESRERTPWAMKHLRTTAVTLQFDTRAGLRYAHTYESAPPPGALGVEQHHTLGCANPPAANAAPATTHGLMDDVGLFGDGSHDFQDRLTRMLCGWIEN